MSVEITHTAIGLTFLMCWALIGQFAIHRREHPELSRTEIPFGEN